MIMRVVRNRIEEEEKNKDYDWCIVWYMNWIWLYGVLRCCSNDATLRQMKIYVKDQKEEKQEKEREEEDKTNKIQLLTIARMHLNISDPIGCDAHNSQEWIKQHRPFWTAITQIAKLDECKWVKTKTKQTKKITENRKPM